MSNPLKHPLMSVNVPQARLDIFLFVELHESYRNETVMVDNSNDVFDRRYKIAVCKNLDRLLVHVSTLRFILS
jgi:hypothetical protein